MAPAIVVTNNSPIGAGRNLLRIRLGIQRITRKEIGEVKSILSNAKRDMEQVLERIPAEALSESLIPTICDSSGHIIRKDDDMSMTVTPTLENLNPSTSLLQDRSDFQYHSRCLVAFHMWAREFLSLIVERVRPIPNFLVNSDVLHSYTACHTNRSRGIRPFGHLFGRKLCSIAISLCESLFPLRRILPISHSNGFGPHRRWIAS